MNHIDVDLNVAPFRQVVHEYSGYQSLTDVPRAIVFNDPFLEVKVSAVIILRPDVFILIKHVPQEYRNQPTSDILEAFRNLEGYYGKCQLLGYLLKREGPDFQVEEDLTVQEALVRMNDQAGVLRLWGAVRYASSLLCQLVDSISPFVTTILVNGKQLTFGVVGKEEVVIDMPMSPAELREVIYSKVQPHDIVQAALQQELALYCGKLIVTTPDIFEGILKIRIG